MAGTVCSGAGAPTARRRRRGSLLPCMLCAVATGRRHGAIAICSVQWCVVCRYINFSFVSQLTMHWRAAIVNICRQNCYGSVTVICYWDFLLLGQLSHFTGLYAGHAHTISNFCRALSRTLGLCRNVAESGCSNPAIRIQKSVYSACTHACLPGTYTQCRTAMLGTIVGDVLLLHGMRPIFCR